MMRMLASVGLMSLTLAAALVHMHFSMCCTALSGTVRSIIFDFITTVVDMSPAISYVLQLPLTRDSQLAQDVHDAGELQGTQFTFSI